MLSILVSLNYFNIFLFNLDQELVERMNEIISLENAAIALQNIVFLKKKKISEDYNTGIML